MVVDALDLCYTKSHVDTFVIISGDSDFSPLVSKLRENNKLVIGVGMKNSSSELLIANCDEFIFYDDLVRESEAKRRKTRKPAVKPTPETPVKPAPEAPVKPEQKDNAEEEKKQKALDLVVETVEALFDQRGEEDKLWGSMIKQALRRRKPGFNESYYGFRSFSRLLEEARDRHLLVLELDQNGQLHHQDRNPRRITTLFMIPSTPPLAGGD